MLTAHIGKQKKLVSNPCMHQNQVQEIGQGHRHRLGWRERGEMYCAPLMVEGFEQEDPAKVRGKITVES